VGGDLRRKAGVLENHVVRFEDQGRAFGQALGQLILQRLELFSGLVDGLLEVVEGVSESFVRHVFPQGIDGAAGGCRRQRETIHGHCAPDEAQILEQGRFVRRAALAVGRHHQTDVGHGAGQLGRDRAQGHHVVGLKVVLLLMLHHEHADLFVAQGNGDR